MRVAPSETPTEADRDAPVARPRPRTEPIIALGRAVLQQRLPAWAIVTVVVVAMLAFAAKQVIAPLLEAQLVTAAELELKLGELREAGSRRQVEDAAEQATALSELERRLLEQVTTQISESIGASQENCPRDLALLLRWMVATDVIDRELRESLPPDLKLCALLQEREETRKHP